MSWPISPRPSAPRRRPLPSSEVRALDALLSRRQQLLEMQVMESNRLGSCADATVRAGLERHLAWLKAEVADADRRLAEAVKASPAWREKDELLRSIPGLGPVSSLTLLAALPELGALDGGKLSALVGLAPFADDSGARRGGRHVRGGRAAVRRVAVPGGAIRGAVQPGPEGVPGPAGGPGQEGEGDPDGGRAQAAGDRQRGHPHRPPVGAGAGDGALRFAARSPSNGPSGLDSEHSRFFRVQVPFDRRADLIQRHPPSPSREDEAVPLGRY